MLWLPSSDSVDDDGRIDALKYVVSERGGCSGFDIDQDPHRSSGLSRLDTITSLG